MSAPLTMLAAGIANPLVAGGIALAIAVAGFAGGWTVNGWRLNTKIAEVKAERADEKAKNAEKALDDIKTATATIRAAAADSAADVSTLNSKLDALRKDFRNAPKPKLPADCKPGDVRMRNLEAAIDAVNEAGAR